MIDVVFTGPAPRKVSRDLMIAAAKAQGITARTSFCSKTQIVVAPHEWIKGEKESTKLRKAREKGAAVMSYHRFINEFDLANLVF